MEIYVSVMAGFVLGFFLLAGEIVALRKRMQPIARRLKRMQEAGEKTKFAAAICGIAAFFLIQPVLIALLVTLALGNLDMHFTANLMQAFGR